ncbi:MAG: MBL fold metallo-hydrolase [Candidatus Omnitrophica bacterium]|jgi:ribonuclease BN (tRNA processing enzyme)|nr:MBL fold metallo-hydrolase [Candidatus Omnitrophota bacterium]
MVRKKEIEFIKFLGTSGARFVMIKQLRASGGIWISAKGKNILVDPGPGSLVRAHQEKLNPQELDAIILTHRHLDHSNDINVMIEAMTDGGFNKKGIIFFTQDAISKDSVILKYALKFPKEIKILKPYTNYRVGQFMFKTSMAHIHPVETYGIKFSLGKSSVGLVSDTKYFPGLEKFFKTDILILPVVFLKPRDVQHLSLEDAKKLISVLSAKKTILTHFGMGMLKAGPAKLARKLSRQLKLDVVSAYDGQMIFP